MNGLWLGAAGAGMQYAPGGLDRASGRPLRFTVRRLRSSPYADRRTLAKCCVDT